MHVSFEYGLQVLGDPERSVIEKRIESIVKEGQRFDRVVVSRDEALAMFTENKFKVGCGLLLGSC